jgi:hypothetical protein
VPDVGEGAGAVLRLLGRLYVEDDPDRDGVEDVLVEDIGNASI